MSELTAPVPSFDVAAVRGDFPILSQKIHGRPLVYLDSAASAQKPRAVIDEVTRFYREDYANIHRGVYELGERATRAFEAAREKVRGFINAGETRECVFTSGTTAAINLVAQSLGRQQLRPGDEILVSTMEHHSNIVPWQLVAEQTGATVRAIPIDDRGALRMDAFTDLLGPRTRIVAVSHQSNSLGTVNPIRAIVAEARAAGAVTLIDGAQAVPHHAVDVQALGCDFYAFSGHKMYAPSGIGVLYGRAGLLESMPPWQGGGEMIQIVSFERTTYAGIPHKFEAGTPNIVGAIGLGAAIDYLNDLGMDAVARQERTLLEYATTALEAIPGLRLIGTAPEKASILSFVLDGVHPHDAATIFDREGVAVRAGHHCAQPVMKHFDVPATIRASLGVYNTPEDIHALVRAIERAQKLFA